MRVALLYTDQSIALVAALAHGQQAPAAASVATAAIGSSHLATAGRPVLQNHPSYQAAISEREAGQTNRAMGRDGLFPQVSASLWRTRMDGTLDSTTASGTVATEDLDYTAKTNENRATQSVFNWSRIAEYRQGH